MFCRVQKGFSDRREKIAKIKFSAMILAFKNYKLLIELEFFM